MVFGINLDGQKELLGLWLAETEGAKFGLSVLSELQQRGEQDILIFAVGGRSGFPEAINAVFPQTKIMLCFVHILRNSLKFLSWKDRKRVAAELKKICGSVIVDEAEQELVNFAELLDGKYRSISHSWQRHWPNLITLFDHPDDISKVNYTTNANESLNSVIRKVVKNRKVFPHDQMAMKVVCLTIYDVSRKWTMPIKN